MHCDQHLFICGIDSAQVARASLGQRTSQGGLNTIWRTCPKNAEKYVVDLTGDMFLFVKEQAL